MAKPPFRSPLWFDKITILGLLKAKTETNSAKVKVVTFLTLVCFAMYNCRTHSELLEFKL